MTTPSGGWIDPELEDLFGDDPSLQETANLLRAARPEPVVDPDFQRRLRVQLMQAAAARPSRARPPRTLRPPFWLRLRTAHYAWGGLAAGAALAAAAVLALVTGSHEHDRRTTVIATSPVAAQHLVSPDNTITVSFNQPMNHAAIESGLRIEPATKITTAWNGNQLVITPLHHLAGNTAYTVTIARSAMVAASGARGTEPVQISFGTAPTPPPTVGAPAPPVLSTTDLGAAQSSGGLLLFAPDGGVVTNAAGVVTPSPSLAPSSAPSPSPSPSPTPTVSPTPETSPGVSPSPSPAGSLPSLPAVLPTPTPASSGTVLAELPSSPGTAVVLGPGATAAAFSPDGASLASAVPDARGGSDITVSRADGSNRSTLTRSTAPVVAVAWASGGRIEYATAQAVQTVDRAGAVKTVASPAGTVAGLSPDGSRAYLAPAGGTPGQVLTLADGSLRPLTGAGLGSTVAFSGDGSTIAWVDTSSAQPRLRSGPVAGDGAAAVSVLDPDSALSALTLNRDGSAVAYTETLPNGTGKLVLAQLPSGAALATGPAASSAAFSPQGDAVALLTGGGQGARVALAQVPGAATTAAPSIPTAASQLLHAFLDAQVGGDHNAISSLAGPGVPAAALTPQGLSRALLVDAVAKPDGSVDAIARLVIDPALTRTATLVTDETLTVARSGGSYLVTALNATQLHPQAAGPHVVSVTTAQQSGHLVVLVGFDSDLAPASVPGAIAVRHPSGSAAPAQVAYDSGTRTATVTVTQPLAGALSLVVGTSLHDVNGQSPPASFTAPIVAG